MDPPPVPDSKPGKIRTWWHPLLANFLRWQLGSHYHLEEEKLIGQKPLQIDILLLRRLQGELSQHVQQVLAGLVEYFNDYTLVEFKSPSDTLRAGDFQTFLAYSLLYRAQTEPLLDPSKLHLVVIAPRLTKPYRDELDILGVTAHEGPAGICSLQGGVLIHRTWLLETEKLAGQSHPLLTLFSPQFLKDGRQTYAQLRQAGYTELVVYLAQQIHQFQQRGEEFAMQHLGTEDEMNQALRDILATLPVEERLAVLSESEMNQALRDFLATLPVDERLAGLSESEILAHTSVDKLLANIPPEQRLQGLAPEQRLQGLAPEELEKLRKLLLSRKDEEGPANPK